MRLLVSIQLILCLALIAPALADKITLSNGRVVEGRILRQDERTVVVESNGMRLSLDATSITAIERAPVWQVTLLDAETNLKRREALRAIDQLYAARREGAPDDSIRSLVERQHGGISGAIFQTDPRRRTELGTSMRRLMQDDLLTTRSLYLFSQGFFQMEDWESAAEALERMPAEDLASSPQIRRWTLDLMRGLVRRQLIRNDYQAAINTVERMRRVAGDEGDPQFPLVHLARAASAREKGDFATALGIIVHELAPRVPEIARNRAAFAVGAAVNHARLSRRWAEARAQLEPIRELYPMEYRVAANDLIEEEAREALDRDEPHRAIELISPIPGDQRSTDLVALLRIATHEAAMKRLVDASPLELLKHGRWCADEGLLDEALQVFIKTRTNDTLRDISDELIALTQLQRDIILIEKANRAYRDGNLDLAQRHCREIIDFPTRVSLLEPDAKAILELVQKSRARERERRPYEAEVLFQRAERAYYLQSLEESFNLLSLLLREFSDTPAAGRAAELFPSVLQSLEIAFLEGGMISLKNLQAEFPIDRIRQADKLTAEVNRLLEAAAWPES
jgi:tetratricopeptide (TPR) repeat protein